MATVKLFGTLRKHVDASHLQIPGESVLSVVVNLCAENQALYETLFEDGQLRRHFKITLNGQDISLADGMETRLNKDDQIAIFSPIAGG